MTAGLVSQVFDEDKLRALTGDMAIGHVRYSTTGGGSWENAQPIWRDDGRELALAHNGNLTNAVELYNRLRRKGLEFRGTTDSEIIAALISSDYGRHIEDAVANVMPQLEGAYSTVVMTKHAIVAFRDPYGIRPLSLGQMPDGAYVFASESCAFDIIGAKLVREVSPGEMISLSERGLESRQVVTSDKHRDVRLRAHLLLPPRHHARRQAPSGGARHRWARSSGARPRSKPTW